MSKNEAYFGPVFAVKKKWVPELLFYIALARGWSWFYIEYPKNS